MILSLIGLRGVIANFINVFEKESYSIQNTWRLTLPQEASHRSKHQPELYFPVHL